ncbi:hypothetical protein KM043_005757 [Ampulex compressa]|nr:hypothetical protein KM043_005757 [Ampulex compressa]
MNGHNNERKKAARRDRRKERVRADGQANKSPVPMTESCTSREWIKDSRKFFQSVAREEDRRAAILSKVQLGTELNTVGARKFRGNNGGNPNDVAVYIMSYDVRHDDTPAFFRASNKRRHGEDRWTGGQICIDHVHGRTAVRGQSHGWDEVQKREEFIDLDTILPHLPVVYLLGSRARSSFMDISPLSLLPRLAG